MISTISIVQKQSFTVGNCSTSYHRCRIKRGAELLNDKESIISGLQSIMH